MNKIKEKLQEIIDFFEIGNIGMVGWDKKKIIYDILHEMKSLKGYSADEVGLEWDGEHLMSLDDFTDEFFTIIISKVCNVLNSFQNEI